jgi:hypothetical protein
LFKVYKPFINRYEVDDLDPIPIEEREQLQFGDFISRTDIDIDELRIPLSDKLLFKAIKHSINEHKTQRYSKYRIVDRYDSHFKPEDQGILGKVQMNYFNTRCRNYLIREHNQISRLRFNVHKDEWEGVQLEGNGEFFIVKLTEKWVISNFPKYWEIFKKKVWKGTINF